MKKQILRTPAAAAVLAIAAALAACGHQAVSRISVTTVPAQTGRIVKNIEITGVLAPSRSVNLFAKISGQVSAVTADVGDTVREGQLVVQIDTKELNAQLLVAEAALDGVRAQAELAKSGVDTAQLNLDMAQRAYDRTKTLMDTKVVMQGQLDDAQNKLDLAKAAFETASRQYRTANGPGIAQAEAQVNLIRVQISNSMITSPIGGIVTNRNINPGEISSMSTPLLSIANTAELRLQGNVSQEEVVGLKLGYGVNITVDAMPSVAYTGKIAQIGPIAASTGQYFPVAISVMNDGNLLAGMTAKAVFTLTASDGVVVPLSAIGDQKDGQAFVYVVSDGKAHRRPVVLGPSNNTNVQVLSGLAAGEVVSNSNVSVLQDGIEVTQ